MKTMKKQIFYLASAALALGLAACSSDELEGSYSVDANGGPIFTASIEQPVSPETRTVLEGNAFKWVKGDNLGIFHKNTAYNFKTTDDKGSFVVANGEGETENSTDFSSGFDWNANAKYAFYPYEAMKKAQDESARTTLTNNKFYVVLDGMTVEHTEGSANTYGSESDKTDGFIDYTDETAYAVKMPMAGTVSNGKIKFKNLTAIVQFTVKNIPAKFTRAILENTGSKPIAGDARIDIAEQTLTIVSDDNTKTAIGYKWTAGKDETTSTKTFNFILPVGDYASGLSFYLEEENASEKTPLYIFTAEPLTAELNWMYTNTFTINGDGDGLASEEISTANSKLAAAGDEISVDVNLAKVSEENGVIILPRAYASATNSGKVVLNLTGLAQGSTKTITVMEDQAGEEGYVAAENVTIKGANAGDLTLDIQLPHSKVTLGDGTTATTYKAVSSETSEEALVVKKAVTISDDLTINGGNVFVESGAALTDKKVALGKKGDKDVESAFLIYQAPQVKSDLTGKVASGNEGITVVPEFVYTIQTATGKIEEPIKVTESLEDLKKAITVKEGADITIDLQGYTLKSEASVLSLAKNATVKVQNNPVDANNDKGVIESTSTSVAAIDVQDGSELTVVSGIVKNAANGPAVTVGSATSSVDTDEEATTPATAKFILNGGTITGTAEKDGILASADANVQLLAGTITAGDVTFDGEKVEAKITVSLPERLYAKNGAKVTVLNKDEQGDDLTVELAGYVYAQDNSTVAISATSLKGLLAVQTGSELTLNEGELAGRVGVSGTGSKFTMKGGSVTYSNAKLTTITATAGTDVSIEAGEITNKAGTAISFAGSNLTITDGTIKGGVSAVNITAGTLTVNDDKEPKLYGDNYVISAVPASSKTTVKVYLDAAGAYYYGNKDKGNYSVYNHNESSDAAAAIESISGGHFIGDIISDNSRHFISGGFFQSCTNLESTEGLEYFITTKKPGSDKDVEGYWTVVAREL
jgi:hypothetical protein